MIRLERSSLDIQLMSQISWVSPELISQIGLDSFDVVTTLLGWMENVESGQLQATRVITSGYYYTVGSTVCD